MEEKSQVHAVSYYTKQKLSNLKESYIPLMDHIEKYLINNKKSDDPEVKRSLFYAISWQEFYS